MFMSANITKIRERFARYLDAFESGDADAAAAFYDPPCMFISDSICRVLTTHADIAGLLGNMRRELARKDYRSSPILSEEIDVLSPGLALLSVVVSRLAADGRELERLTARYTLRLVDGAWRCACVVAYPAGEPTA
jgi:ketosteroid isomerase-like protein